MKVIEEITEGNGTYQNTLFLINEEMDTTYIFNHYNPHLTKSYEWDWETVTPKPWLDYLKEIKYYQELTDKI